MNEESGVPTPQEHKTGSTGPFVGIVIIVLVLILGGLYFWGSYLNEQDALNASESAIEESSADGDIAGPADEPDRIESDLDSFDAAAFDASLEASLQAAESEF